MAPGEPPRKPWGAPASYGRGAKKPPAVGAPSIWYDAVAVPHMKPSGNSSRESASGAKEDMRATAKQILTGWFRIYGAQAHEVGKCGKF